MVIDGITCCVGQTYVGYLKKSIGTWYATLNSITIVTDARTAPDLHQLARLVDKQNVKVIISDLFYRYGAFFNKAAGLCSAYYHASPTDWVLHFDSDIVPPLDWRTKTLPQIAPGNLYGAFRFSGDGQILDEHPLFPYGYFHLWSVRHPTTWRWPLFEVHHPHAGNYDANFAELWSRPCRMDLGFELLHQGVCRQNWFSGNEGMRSLLDQGLLNTRLKAKRGEGILKLPAPQLQVRFHRGSVEWVLEVLKACAASGPFLVEARAFDPSEPFAGLLLSEVTGPEEVRKQIAQGLERNVSGYPV
jgi:hypothetical protein